MLFKMKKVIEIDKEIIDMMIDQQERMLEVINQQQEDIDRLLAVNTTLLQALAKELESK